MINQLQTKNDYLFSFACQGFEYIRWQMSRWFNLLGVTEMCRCEDLSAFNKCAYLAKKIPQKKRVFCSSDIITQILKNIHWHKLLPVGSYNLKYSPILT